MQTETGAKYGPWERRAEAVDASEIAAEFQGFSQCRLTLRLTRESNGHEVVAMRIRPASQEDIPAILEIYNEAVMTTTATYDYEPQTLEQRQAWLKEHEVDGYPVIVAELERHGVVAWGSLSRFHPKTGYRFTVENTLYVGSAHRGKGIGRRLLQKLVEAAAERNMRVVVALIDAENGSSIRLHESMGFEKVALLKEVGFKFDRWLDVVYMQLILRKPGVV